jgi:uncharacterized PurR-regulated membrane protein YhhQ (DUF165 family)
LIRKILLLFAAAGAALAAAGVVVVSLAYALYALMRDVFGFGAASSAAVVAGAVALIFLILFGVLAIKAGAKPKEAPMVERLKTIVRERPIVAASAALAAGVFAVKNPKAILPLILAFLEPKSPRRH